jgi:protein TonB
MADLRRPPMADDLQKAMVARKTSMFDLTAEPAKRPLREPSLGSRVTAILAHAAGLIALIAVPVSRAVNVQPELPRIQAFVVPSEPLPALPPAPPPPPAAAPVAPSERVPVAEQAAAPIEPPPDVQPEPASPPQVDAGAGREGGVEGGVPTGVVGGVVGGLGAAAPVPPAPRPPPARSAAPVRVSGSIKTPDLLRRVEPVYSVIAAASHISGVVIVEAVVDVHGSVESVRIVRSRGPLLDNAATEALKQWKYAPLIVADVPMPFEVTVTFNFRIPTA